MAPNLKRLNSISQSLSDLKVVRPKERLAPATKPVVDSASYWEWPATEQKDLFSAAHLESNLVQYNSTTAPQHTVPAHDEYWAERDQEDIPMMAQHERDAYWAEASSTAERANYWTWESESSKPLPSAAKVADGDDYWNMSAQSSSDDYWAEDTTVQQLPAAQIPANDNYWQWSNGPSESDQYWRQTESNNYWQWSSEAKNHSDAYWTMAY